MGNKTGCVNAKNTRTATGLFPVVSECSDLRANKPKRSSARRGRCRAKARPLQVPRKVRGESAGRHPWSAAWHESVV